MIPLKLGKDITQERVRRSLKRTGLAGEPGRPPASLETPYTVSHFAGRYGSLPFHHTAVHSVSAKRKPVFWAPGIAMTSASTFLAAGEK